MNAETLKVMLEKQKKELAELVEAANKEIAYRRGQVDLLEKLVHEEEAVPE
jgi:hypothetical protein